MLCDIILWAYKFLCELTINELVHKISNFIKFPTEKRAHAFSSNSNKFRIQLRQFRWMKWITLPKQTNKCTTTAIVKTLPHSGNRYKLNWMLNSLEERTRYSISAFSCVYSCIQKTKAKKTTTFICISFHFISLFDISFPHSQKWECVSLFFSNPRKNCLNAFVSGGF